MKIFDLINPRVCVRTRTGVMIVERSWHEFSLNCSLPFRLVRCPDRFVQRGPGVCAGARAGASWAPWTTWRNGGSVWSDPSRTISVPRMVRGLGPQCAYYGNKSIKVCFIYQDTLHTFTPWTIITADQPVLIKKKIFLNIFL